MICQRAEPGNSTAHLPDLCRSKEGYESSRCGSAKFHRGDAWGDGDGDKQAAWHPHRQRRCEEGNDDPEHQASDYLGKRGAELAVEFDSDVIVDTKHKARANQRNCADCHEPNDVELQGLGH